MLSLHRELISLIDQCEQWCVKHRLNTNDVQLDHVGYRCESAAVFENLRAECEKERFIYQSEISQRRIAIIGLAEPLKGLFWQTSILELSEPKPGVSESSCADHAELYSPSLNYTQLRQYIEGSGIVLIEKQRPHHTTFQCTIDGGITIKLTQQRLVEKFYAEEINVL